MTTEIHNSTTCRAGVNGARCEMCEFAEESARNCSELPSDASGAENRPAGFLEPGTKNVSEAILAQSSPILVPTFDQEWQDAPRWVREYVEQGRLRAVLFDVIDAGCNCAVGKGHPWRFNDDNEDFANEQRTQFVDEVIRRLQTTKTNIAQYWFIRGQYAKEVELLVGENGDLKELLRVVRERRLT